MISGIPSSGKTTYSRELANLLSIDTIIEVDYIYFDFSESLSKLSWLMLSAAVV